MVESSPVVSPPLSSSVPGGSPTTDVSGGQFVREYHPSIGSTWVGHWLGRLYQSLPFLTPTVRWSHLLFCLPTSPIAAGLWLWLKVSGCRYVATTTSAQRRRNIGDQLIDRVLLDEVCDVRVEADLADTFFNAGNVVFVGAGGQTLGLWKGVAEPDSVRGTLLELVQLRREMSRTRTVVAARST